MFRYYIIAIAAAVAFIFGTNVIFASVYALSPLYIFVCVICCAAAAFAIDAAAALAVRYLIPKKFYNPLAKRFNCLRMEKRLYTKLGIRKWKDKIPETGGLLVGFGKSHATELHNNAYVYKFMQETCYAEVMHLLSVPLGFLVLPLCPHVLRVGVALPVAVINSVLQLLPAMVQRFVRPQLLRVYKGNLKKQGSDLRK